MTFCKAKDWNIIWLTWETSWSSTYTDIMSTWQKQWQVYTLCKYRTCVARWVRLHFIKQKLRYLTNLILCKHTYEWDMIQQTLNIITLFSSLHGKNKFRVIHVNKSWNILLDSKTFKCTAHSLVHGSFHYWTWELLLLLILSLLSYLLKPTPHKYYWMLEKINTL